jgi:hypothetical protein
MRNPNLRPTAPWHGGFVLRFGMFAGPNYCGGRTFADGQIPDPQAWDVAPVGLLDDVTRNHDIYYTYIEHVYGNADVASRSRAYWRADKEMLHNVLGYRPANWLEGQYRKALIQAFVAKADMKYGKHVDLIEEWNESLADLDPDYGPLRRRDDGSIDWPLHSLLWHGATYGATGMELLATSGVNVQIALLFNQHIDAKTPIRPLESGAGDGAPDDDYTARLLVPRRVPGTHRYTASGRIGAGVVELEYDAEQGAFSRSLFRNGRLETRTEYRQRRDRDGALVCDRYGHAEYAVSVSRNGHFSGATEAPLLPQAVSKVEACDHFQEISAVVLQGDAEKFPSTPTAADIAWHNRV